MTKRKYEEILICEDSSEDIIFKKRKKNDSKHKSKIKYESTDDTWISASSIHNYLLKDPILDYYKYSFKSGIISSVNNANNANKNNQFSGSSSSNDSDSEIENNFEETFLNFILKKGITFEQKVMEHITKIIGSENIYQVCNNQYDITKRYFYKKTKKLIRNRVPIIYQGALHDSEKRIFGSPDLIVRSDIIQTLFNDDVYMDPILFKDSISRNPKYYCIVDIKYNTLHLRSDGIHLLNTGRTVCNKGQIMIYNKIIGKIQKHVPRYCYVLGRGYNYSKQENKIKTEYTGTSCMDRLGHIDVEDVDKDYNELIDNAINWVRNVRINKHTWKLNPPSIPELYPNMKNKYDMPYHHLKKELADEIKEITSIWNVGIEHRKNAHKNGIYKFDDPALNIDILGISDKKKGKIINKMLSMLHGDEIMIPTKINNNYMNWKKKPVVEFFIDFETINNLVDPLEKIPEIGAETIVFMIGLYVVKYDGNGNVVRSAYYNLLADKLDNENEEKIFRDLIQTIEEELKINNVKHANFYHWGHVERTIYEGICNKYNINYNINFVDFCRIFNDEPILMKGVFDFSLKSVAKFLIKHKLINHEDYKISGGLEAMVIAYKCYVESELNGAEMLNIIEYNKYDCIFIWEIINYLRNNKI